jgi:hypothetical protein
LVHERRLLGQQKAASAGAPDVQHRCNRPSNKNQEQSSLDDVRRQVLLTHLVLVLSSAAVNDRDVVSFGETAHPTTEATGHAHQMGVVQLFVGPVHQAPPPVPKATSRVAQRHALTSRPAIYFGRNLRTIEVLIDQDVVKTGAASHGESWRFYDLGHGYCTYDFFDQCPHRMACAKCAFYRPKGSGQAQLLEAKANLLRLKQEIPLTDAESAAVAMDSKRWSGAAFSWQTYLPHRGPRRASWRTREASCR